MRLLHLLFAVLIFLTLSAPASDGLILKNSERISCELTGADAQHLFIRLQSATDANAKVMSWPREDIASLEFGPNAQRDSFITSATKEQSETLAELWRQFSALLEVPASPSARIGLKYGLLLLEDERSESKKAALRVFCEVALRAANLKDRESALQGELKSWIALGNQNAALKEAESILARDCGAPLRAEARLVLAADKEQRLEALVKDNPRWQEDENVRGERNALYNGALDLYLLSSLLPNVPPDLRLRGLWGAFCLQRQGPSAKDAENTATDLITFFPDSIFAERAHAFLASLPAETPNSKPKEPRQYAQDPSTRSATPESSKTPSTAGSAEESSPTPAAASPSRRKRSRH